MSSRLAAASNSLFVTTHGGSMPNATPNNSVSPIASTSSGAASPRPSWLGGAAPEPPGYLTHDDAPGVSVYRGRVVQPGTAMTAHGDEVRCHTGAGPFSAALRRTHSPP